MAPSSAGQSVRGLFVTFEGGEGAGKSTQIERLRERLLAEGHDVLRTREPGGSDCAEKIRAILLEGRAKALGADGEAILFAAARQDHVATMILPALNDGRIVLCDRFVDSTRVYQGSVAGVSEGLLAKLEEASIADAKPDLTVVIDVPAEIGLERAGRRRVRSGEAPDRFEAEGAAYHAKVRDAFLAIAAAEPERCVVIDGARPADEVEASIWAAMAARLSARAG